MPAATPLVGIEPDVIEDPRGPRLRVSNAYAERIAAAGGLPIVMTPDERAIPEYLARLNAIVLTGGDDPRTEPFGVPTDPRVTPVHPLRQQFATALLAALHDERPDTPVLGVCLGMQMMALTARGTLDQFMPDAHADTHADHWDRDHAIVPADGSALAGVCHSRHKQCVANPGSLHILARAPDGVTEAIGDPTRRHYLGVQWHPERSPEPALGQTLFDRLVAAAR